MGERRREGLWALGWGPGVWLLAWRVEEGAEGQEGGCRWLERARRQPADGWVFVQ